MWLDLKRLIVHMSLCVSRSCAYLSYHCHYILRSTRQAVWQRYWTWQRGIWLKQSLCVAQRLLGSGEAVKHASRWASALRPRWLSEVIDLMKHWTFFEELLDVMRIRPDSWRLFFFYICLYIYYQDSAGWQVTWGTFVWTFSCFPANYLCLPLEDKWSLLHDSFGGPSWDFSWSGPPPSWMDKNAAPKVRFAFVAKCFFKIEWNLHIFWVVEFRMCLIGGIGLCVSRVFFGKPMGFLDIPPVKVDV